MSAIFKVIVVVLLLVVIFSLGQALYYMMTDKGTTDRTVKALTRRIGLSVGLILLVLLAIFSSGALAMWAILAVGLFNSIMFPTIFTLTLERSSAPASATSGLLVFGIIGGALLPQVAAHIADAAGKLQPAFIVPMLGYVGLTIFAIACIRTKARTEVTTTASH